MKAKTRRLIALLLSVVMALSLFSVTARADDGDDTVKITEGRIGDNLSWQIMSVRGTIVLEITGSGGIPNYPSPDETPWAAYRAQIAWISIERASNIGENAFAGFSKLSTVVFYGNAPTVGESVFADGVANCYFYE